MLSYVKVINLLKYKRFDSRIQLIKMSKTEEANNYLDNKVKVIFEPLVAALIKEKAADPVINNFK